MDHKKVVIDQLQRLKTEYITMRTSIEHAEADLVEARSTVLQVLGGIKNLELLLENLNKSEEEKPTRTGKP